MSETGGLDQRDNRDNGAADARAAIGHWIREHREFLGISQEQLRRRLDAAGVHVAQSTLSRWEQGELAPPAELLAQLARALGTSLDTFEEVVARARRAATVDLTGRSLDELRDDADRAARVGNLYDALALLEAAVDLARLGTTPVLPEELGGILLRLAWVQYNLWHIERARATLRELAGLEGLPAGQRLRRTLLRIAVEQRYGDGEAASILARHAEARLADETGRDRAYALHALGQFRFTRDEYEEAARLLREARQAWQEAGNPVEVARCGVLLGYCLHRTGQGNEGRRILDASLRAAEENHWRDIAIQGQRLLGRALGLAGQVDAAIPHLENAISLARASGFPEEEFLAAWYAWGLLDGEPRERMARRLRRLLSRVHPRLPEARTFVERTAARGEGKEDDR